MRLAVVSDVHGNLTALEAVIADLNEINPDLVVHGGDLAYGGFRPAEVVDRIRELGWPGVQGNTDEALWSPRRLSELTTSAPKLQGLWEAISKCAAATSDLIGSERIEWLRAFPTIWRDSDSMISIIHASPEDLWRAPLADASDEELQRVYGSLGSRLVVYGHIHRPFVRALRLFTVANCGSVSLSYDGDPRASYLVFESGKVTIRRLAYDAEVEVRGLIESGYPYADWLGRMLQTGRYEPPYVNASARRQGS